MERLLGRSLLRQARECANTVILRQKNAAAAMNAVRIGPICQSD
jgi:hypothetical protein